jgi:hypothetical protein
MAVGSAINKRSMFATIVRDVPCGNSVPVLRVRDQAVGLLGLVAVMNSFVFDFALRAKLVGQNLNYFVISEIPLIRPSLITPSLMVTVAKLSLTHLSFAPTWYRLSQRSQLYKIPPTSWAITRHERLRLRSMIDAIIATLYHLTREQLAWILKDSDHPVSKITQSAFSRRLDPKGFWRVDKSALPELRHTVLTLKAFDDLQLLITKRGDINVGIQAFCDQHNGQGWMVPETLCLKELGLTRTLNINHYDDRALTPQPVRASLGERFQPWQLKQSREESWAEIKHHAQVINHSQYMIMPIDDHR